MNKIPISLFTNLITFPPRKLVEKLIDRKGVSGPQKRSDFFSKKKKTKKRYFIFKNMWNTQSTKTISKGLYELFF